MSGLRWAGGGGGGGDWGGGIAVVPCHINIPLHLSDNSDILKITSLHRDFSVDIYEGRIEGLILGR